MYHGYSFPEKIQGFFTPKLTGIHICVVKDTLYALEQYMPWSAGIICRRKGRPWATEIQADTVLICEDVSEGF